VNSTNFLIHLLLLVLGILLTGVGVCLTLHMNILPNAADGFVQAVSTQTGKKLGIVKNMLDLTSVIITLVICFLFAGKIIGIGLGTVLAVIGVGRVIAFSNGLLHNKLVELAY
ncbi:MAG TPA: DUF6198 family protein, partial [Oscillospiraceae bacterium]|nr:DUF6198 family protein [Oscillospiraceae bacterium]